MKTTPNPANTASKKPTKRDGIVNKKTSSTTTKPAETAKVEAPKKRDIEAEIRSIADYLEQRARKNDSQQDAVAANMQRECLTVLFVE